MMPVVNIHTIGAGGGSIAYSEAGGLRVGPESAGADPGPACYGRGGTRPTVTDANLFLGRVDPEWFAGGTMQLDVDAANQAIATLADEFHLDPLRLAEGICDVANAKMAQAIRNITVDRGIEPRESPGRLRRRGPHARCLPGTRAWRSARSSSPHSPARSRRGACWRRCCARTSHNPCMCHWRRPIGPTSRSGSPTWRPTGSMPVTQEGVPAESVRVEYAVDARYASQEYTLTVPVLAADEPVQDEFVATLSRRFDAAHLARFGHCNPGAPVGFVALRTVALGDPDGPNRLACPLRSMQRTRSTCARWCSAGGPRHADRSPRRSPAGNDDRWPGHHGGADRHHRHAARDAPHGRRTRRPHHPRI